MNLSQLQAVFQVVNTGSVSLAASRLFLSQPAVTKQIRSLEEELNVKLFERSGRRLIPAPGTRRVLGRIERVLQELEQIHGELTDSMAGISGEVHVGSGPILARTTMPDVVASCREKYPRMQVSLFESPLPQQGKRLRSGDLRIGFGSDYLEDPDLAFEPLLSDHLVLMLPCDHPLAQSRRPISLKQIRKESVIMHLYSRMVETALRRAGHAPTQLARDNHISTRTSNTETIAAFVARGLGLSLVPRYIVALLNPPNIATLALREKLPIQFGYYRLRAATLTPLELAFVETVTTTLSQRLSTEP